MAGEQTQGASGTQGNDLEAMFSGGFTSVAGEPDAVEAFQASMATQNQDATNSPQDGSAGQAGKQGGADAGGQTGNQDDPQTTIAALMAQIKELVEAQKQTAQESRTNAGRVAALQRQIEVMKSAAPAEPPKKLGAGHKSVDELDSAAPEVADAVRHMIGEAVKTTATTQETQNEGTSQDDGSNGYSVADLNREFSDWQAIVGNPEGEFRAWIQRKGALYAAEALSTNDPKVMADKIRDFKAATAKQHAPNGGETQTSQGSARLKAGSVQVGGRRGAPAKTIETAQLAFENGHKAVRG